jgi:uncharacterized membrane protein
MPSIPNADVTIAMVIVAVVLTFGLANRLRDGSRNTSHWLLRWRVGLLFLGIVIIIVMLAPRMR